MKKNYIIPGRAVYEYKKNNYKNEMGYARCIQ